MPQDDEDEPVASVDVEVTAAFATSQEGPVDEFDGSNGPPEIRSGWRKNSCVRMSIQR